MNPCSQFDGLLRGPEPILALAPMQDVTDLPFWRLMAAYGGADLYYTEYFRVHATSHLEPWILESITQNPTGRPAIAQMIGNDIPALVRTAKELQQHPIAAVDLNLGCPAPVVYRKCAGGGLLREPKRVDAILGALREAVSAPVRFTVKTRLGFADTQVFAELLPIFAKHSVDLVTVHGRTVAEMYRSEVHYDFIARAGGPWRNRLLLLIMIPFWTNFLIRTYAWITILKSEGLLNSLLLSAGAIVAPLELLCTPVAVLIGLVYVYLPFMILPIYGSAEKLDPALIETAQDLGCGPWRAFVQIVLPLTRPGLLAGILMVFVPAIGMFAVTDLMGGARVPMIGNGIQDQFVGQARDKPFGAALGVIFLLLFVAAYWLLQRRGGRFGEVRR